jgi:hypothetical protein
MIILTLKRYNTYKMTKCLLKLNAVHSYRLESNNQRGSSPSKSLVGGVSGCGLCRDIISWRIEPIINPVFVLYSPGTYSTIRLKTLCSRLTANYLATIVSAALQARPSSSTWMVVNFGSRLPLPMQDAVPMKKSA